MPDEILTLPEVAQLLKVAEKTVYTMAQKGALPAFKVGGQWRFKRADIDAWIERQKLEAKGGEVTAPSVKDLSALCETAATLYHRLVLVVGRPRSGKTRLLQATAAEHGWPLINLNQRLSELLLELTQRQRALRVPRLVGDVLAGTRAPVVLSTTSSCCSALT